MDITYDPNNGEVKYYPESYKEKQVWDYVDLEKLVPFMLLNRISVINNFVQTALILKNLQKEG